MRILVTGKDGQLGKSIKKIVNNQNIYKSHDFVFIGKDEFNLTDIKSLNGVSFCLGRVLYIIING